MRKPSIICVNRLFLLGLLTQSLLCGILLGAPVRHYPVTLSQPSGFVFRCFVSGDERYNWLHDQAGYTIVLDPATRYYTYAVLKDGLPAPSDNIVGQADPVALGLIPNVFPTEEKLRYLLASSPDNSLRPSADLIQMPTKGIINNLVIFIRFSEEREFYRPISYYDYMFNATTAGANSLRNYYFEVSYDQLIVSTTFYPKPSNDFVTSYQDSHPRGYYQPYDYTNPEGYTWDQRNVREYNLLLNAINSVAAQVPSSLIVDSDGDSYVDNVCFIISGDITYPTDREKSWMTLLWPREGTLDTPAYINGKRVHKYNFHLEVVLDSQGVGVLAHEMFHSMGAPDLYHYAKNRLMPVGIYDIMDGTLNPPQHMSAYMKYRYGKWISNIPTLQTSGRFILSPLTALSLNAVRINSPYSSTEYFIVEFRKKIGAFESSLYDQGLLVYRINAALDGMGNVAGPPDEVYVYRPGGTVSSNGNDNIAPFSVESSNTEISDRTDPWSFLSNGKPGGLKITDVGFASGPYITFYSGSDDERDKAAKVTQLWPIQDATVDSAAKLWAKVKNIGSVDLPADAVVLYYVAQVGDEYLQIGRDGSYVGQVNVGAIGPNSENWYALNWTITTYQANRYRYWACVYSGDIAITRWTGPMEFTITPKGTTAAKIVSPAAESTLTSSTVVFQWDKGTGASQYWLQVGTYVGGKEIYDQDQGTRLSASISGLPTDGSRIYVRLWSKLADTWGKTYNDYMYITLSKPGKATLVSPSGNIQTTTPTYKWNAVANSTKYCLWVAPKGYPNVPKIVTSYTGAQSGCASGSGTCVATPTTAVGTGPWMWWIQTYNDSGDGPWSDGMEFAVASPPGKATLLSPQGSMTTLTPEYKWNAVANAAYYELYVAPKEYPNSPRIATWYTATQAGCSSGSGTCSLTPTTALANGIWTWWIQTWNDTGYGPWSDGMLFTISDLTNIKVWEFVTSGEVISSPAVSGGYVYVGSSDNKIYCLRANTGAKVWEFLAGSAIESSPAISGGYVYVSDWNGRVYCLRADTGAKVWEFLTDDSIHSSPAVAGGYVYVGSWDHKIYCLRASTGAKVWEFVTGNGIESSPAIAGGYVYVGSRDCKVYCLRADTGAKVWEFVTGDWISWSSPAVTGGYVYVGSVDGRLYCLRADTGAKVWEYPTGHWVQSSPAVAGGYVYVGNETGYIWCFRADTGAEVWRFHTIYTNGGVSSSPAVVGGYVYAGGSDGNVYCLRADIGAKVWEFVTSNRVYSSPAVAGGYVYVGGSDRKVYCLRAPNSEADSWPMFKYNPERTGSK